LLSVQRGPLAHYTFLLDRVHRLYVVDGAGVLCGVVTLSDLMNHIVTEWGMDQ
jgi:CBS-domain-containing membrane protein